MHAGRNRRGIDCLGLLMHAGGVTDDDLEECHEAKELLRGYYGGNRWIYDRKNPEHRRSCRILLDALTKRLREITKDQLKPGDILLMRIKTKVEDDLGDHVAIYMGKNMIIHSHMKLGVIEQPMDEKYWDRVIRCYRRD